MRSRRVFAAAMAALCLTSGVAACGGTSSDDLARQIDQRLENQGSDNGLPVSSKTTAQDQAEIDMRDAAEAKRRRKELADLDKAREAETAKIMKEGVAGGNDADTTVPIGTADPAVEKFRAQLTGVCEGGQARINKITVAAEKAKKSKDPAALLKIAQDYTKALSDFQAALNGLDAPASEKQDYAAWLLTIGALSTNIRVQLAVQGDPAAAAKYQKKTEALATKLLEQSAVLGVTCLSVVS